MSPSLQEIQTFIDRVRPFLPLPAYPRPQLRESLRKNFPDASVTSGCAVTNVFFAGDAHGLMCHLTMDARSVGAPTFVAPITHLAFGRQHPLAREITAFQKSCNEIGAPAAASPAKREISPSIRRVKATAKPHELLRRRNFR